MPLLLSVAVMVMEKVPAVVGVPLSRPPLDKVRPSRLLAVLKV